MISDAFGKNTRKIGCNFVSNTQSKMGLIVIFLVDLIYKTFNLFIATIQIGFKRFVFGRGWHIYYHRYRDYDHNHEYVTSFFHCFLLFYMHIFLE